jgi:hypothetical protein
VSFILLCFYFTLAILGITQKIKNKKAQNVILIAYVKTAKKTKKDSKRFEPFESPNTAQNNDFFVVSGIYYSAHDNPS